MTRVLLASMIAVGSAHCGSSGPPTSRILLGDVPLTVEVADDERERARGLMHRDELAQGRGMLFVYEASAPRHFWMKDTRIPLSIAFVDDAGTIRRIADMQPLTTKRTASLYPARYAIEVPLGWFTASGVEVGDKVSGLPSAE